MDIHDFNGLADAVNDLQRRGFTYSFIDEEYALLNPSEWEIVEHYRFEGMSSAGDNSVVYALENIITGIKALLVDAYGVYNDGHKSAFIEKVGVNEL